jgi:hypothetical protein
MTNLKTLEIVSLDTAYQVAAKDAAAVTSLSPQDYWKNNSLAYYVLLNTWMLMVKEFCKYSYFRVVDLIHKEGLLSVIKRFDEASQRIMHELPVVDPIVNAMQNDITRDGFPSGTPFSKDYTLGTNVNTALLQLLRYPKRFSPNCADVTANNSITKFLATENRNKQLQRREYSRFVIEEARDVVYDLLPWDEICAAIDNMTDQDLILTSGVGVDSTERLGSKLVAISKSHPEFFVSPMGVPYSGAYPQQDVVYWGKIIKQQQNLVKVAAVPKSYKAARIIAMEDTWRQARARWIMNEMVKYLPPTIDITDQSRNQCYAALGSMDGTLATIDMSSASDTITKTLFRELFPNSFVSRVVPLMGTHCQVGNKTQLMQMCSTSGHSLTFIIETIVHYAIARAACNKLLRFGCELDSVLVSAYGDDLIIPTEAFELVSEFFRRVGMIVNPDKSFYSGSYRESCGEEYFEGVRSTTFYFPRFPIIGSLDKKGKVVLGVRTWRDAYRGKVDDSTTMLVDLQKKLFRICYPASRLVYELVKEAHPKMTHSGYGRICPDLWEFDEDGRPITTHQYTIQDGKFTLMGDFELPEIGMGTEDAELFALVDLASNEQLHSSPSMKFVVEKKITPYEQRLLDLYRYQHFLQYGPSYEDALSELLGISSQIAPTEQAFGVGRLVWRYNYING